MKKLIDFIKKGKCPWTYEWTPIFGELLTRDTEYGLLLVLALVVSQGFTYILSEHISYRKSVTSFKLSNALIALIYDKILRLSPATNKKFKPGDLITFIQVDVNKLHFLCFQAPSLAILPITLLGSFYLLYSYLGYVFVVGLIVFLVGFLANVALSRRNAILQKEYMKYQGQRVSLLSETLAKIKTLKFFAWTDIFEHKIKEIRSYELKAQFGKFIVGMTLIAFVFLFPQLMSTITISTYVFLGNDLDLSTAYTIKIVFNYIKDPMRMLPMFFAQLNDFKLAMRRIQQFLVCDEINPSLICFDTQ